MSSPPSSPGSARVYGSGRRAVQTVPTWARNLAPDVMPASQSDTHLPMTLPASSDADDRGLVGSERNGNRWWTFTMPHRPAKADRETTDKGKEREEPAEDYFGLIGRGEKGESRRSTRPSSFEGGDLPRSAMRGLSAHHAQTPGWNSPWQPFHRPAHNPDPFLAMTSGLRASERLSRKSLLRRFLLESPFAPAIARTFNLAFVVSTLAVAVSIRQQEMRVDQPGLIGNSTLLAIVVAPLAIIHILVVVYLEYFGTPLGLTSISTKMSYTLFELLFISLFSAILSLAFDNLFNSPLGCTSSASQRFSSIPVSLGSSMVEDTFADSLCGRQTALVTLVFVSLGLYLAVLVVSLFRIFDKVARNL